MIRLRLPALRERQEDVPALARFFLQKSARDLGVDAKRITDAALARLMRFDFPGNVRQLENVCHWLTVMAPAQTVEPKDLPPELQGELVPRAAAVPVVLESNGATEFSARPLAEVPASALPAVALVPGVGGSAVAGAETPHWLTGLEQDARRRLLAGEPEVWDVLTDQFEARLIQTTLELTRGRRIEAAQKLGIGRNTITRKIQELGLED